MKRKRSKQNLFLNPSYLNSNFALSLGYLNPALNNPAQKLDPGLRISLGLAKKAKSSWFRLFKIWIALSPSLGESL